MNVVSFVDQDMVMRYFGGGIGHLKNAPPLQAPGFDLGPIDPSSEEMMMITTLAAVQMMIWAL